MLIKIREIVNGDEVIANYKKCFMKVLWVLSRVSVSLFCDDLATNSKQHPTAAIKQVLIEFQINLLTFQSVSEDRVTSVNNKLNDNKKIIVMP